MGNENTGILVDTSVWIEFFRSESQTGAQLESLIPENSVWVCGVVIFELLQGVRSEVEKSKVQGALSGLQYAELPLQLWENAADLSLTLKKKGLTMPLSDILIAAIAIEHNLQIFTLDKHFEQIPGVQLYRHASEK